MAEDKFRTHQGQAGTSRQKKIWRLVTHWSERDLAHLPAMQRAAQEREMGNVYETFDEKGLDTALAIMEHEAPAKVESSGLIAYFIQHFMAYFITYFIAYVIAYFIAI